MAAFKLFGLTLASSYLATVALGPTTKISKLNFRGYAPVRWDSMDCEKGRMVGADLMAGTCVYLCLFSHGLWIPGLAIAAVDLAWYGPLGVAMPVTGAVGALTML